MARSSEATAKPSYSLAEVATRWGVSHSSVLMLVYSGDLQAVDVSTNPTKRSRFIVMLDDLLAFEERRRTKPPEAPAPRRRRVSVPAGSVIEFFS